MTLISSAWSLTITYIRIHDFSNLYTPDSVSLASLVRQLFHSSRAISLQPKLFQYHTRLAPYIFQWADYAVYYFEIKSVLKGV